MPQAHLSTSDLVITPKGMLINSQILKLCEKIKVLGSSNMYGLDLYSRTNMHHMLELISNRHIQESCSDDLCRRLEQVNRTLYKKLTACRFAFFGPEDDVVCFIVFKGASFASLPGDERSEDNPNDPFVTWVTKRYAAEQAPQGCEATHTWVPYKPLETAG